MVMLLVVLLLLAGSSAHLDLAMEEPVPQVQVYSRTDMHHDEHYHQPLQPKPHTVFLKEINDHKKKSNVERIVSDLYNPDYMEPMTVLDYRYLKTGGRDYTRGPGGQILILPKGVRINEKKEFENYDEMLEHLRQKQLAELEARQRKMHNLGHGYHKHHHIQITGGHHEQPQYHRASMYGGYKRYAHQKTEDEEAAHEAAE